jgi:cholesterol transport system auxiliary component
MKTRLLFLAGLALLSGCGSLLGGGGSADMYRFGAMPGDPAAVPAAAAAPAMLLFTGANFEPAIDSDRILTVTGAQAGYVADARWIAPAPELFDAAAVRALEQRAPSARVVRLRGAPMPDYALGIEIRRFEADYAAGQEAPPEIVIEGRARLMRWSDRTLIDEWLVTAREPAGENRVGTIVQAFDRGTATIVTQIADRAQQALSRQAALNPSAAPNR